MKKKGPKKKKKKSEKLKQKRKEEIICKKKVAYKSELDAMRRAEELDYDYYRCCECNFWHLTNRKKRESSHDEKMFEMSVFSAGRKQRRIVRSPRERTKIWKRMGATF
jgi:hypothetical protein